MKSLDVEDFIKSNMSEYFIRGDSDLNTFVRSILITELPMISLDHRGCILDINYLSVLELSSLYAVYRLGVDYIYKPLSEDSITELDINVSNLTLMDLFLGMNLIKDKGNANLCYNGVYLDFLGLDVSLIISDYIGSNCAYDWSRYDSSWYKLCTLFSVLLAESDLNIQIKELYYTRECFRDIDLLRAYVFLTSRRCTSPLSYISSYFCEWSMFDRQCSDCVLPSRILMYPTLCGIVCVCGDDCDGKAAICECVSEEYLTKYSINITPENEFGTPCDVVNFDYVELIMVDDDNFVYFSKNRARIVYLCGYVTDFHLRHDHDHHVRYDNQRDIIPKVHSSCSCNYRYVSNCVDDLLFDLRKKDNPLLQKLRDDDLNVPYFVDY
jgi:hypothetical protein